MSKSLKNRLKFFLLFRQKKTENGDGICELNLGKLRFYWSFGANKNFSKNLKKLVYLPSRNGSKRK